MHHPKTIVRSLIALAVFVFVAGGCSSSRTGTTFDSPKQAVDTFVDALRANDTKQLKKILGPDSDRVVSSGDAVADQNQVERFLAAYDVAHRLQAEPDGRTTTLVVGKQEFPFPVPLVKRDDGRYVFDTPAGEEEILNRRIGRNELTTQQVCLAIVDAQQEYVERRPMGGDLPVYARKLMSDPGQKNGLYWPTAEGETPSPLGELVASAASEGYAGKRGSASESPPYRGYRYRLLTKQGPHASGGVMDYEIDGKLIGGFAVVAYPEEYGNSGIMTFITNHDGVVYERDLGPDTAKIAKSMKAFDPGPGWKRSTDASDAAAAKSITPGG